MEEKIEEIWRLYHPELLAYSLRKCGNTEDAQDVLQEAFVKVILNLEKVLKSSNIRQYLYAIVRNTVADYFRNSQHPEGKREEPTICFTEKRERINTELASLCIPELIDQLPPPYREALLLAGLEGYSQKELAHMLGISYSGAKSRFQRGKAQVKARIIECCKVNWDCYGNIWYPDDVQPCCYLEE